jgi:hypothetical protein
VGGAQVVTFDMSDQGRLIGVGAALRVRTGTDVEGRQLESGELAQCSSTAGPAGVWGCRWKGCRDEVP